MDHLNPETWKLQSSITVMTAWNCGSTDARTSIYFSNNWTAPSA